MLDLTSTTFCVPVIDSHSPLGYSIITDIHWWYDKTVKALRSGISLAQCLKSCIHNRWYTYCETNQKILSSLQISNEEIHRSCNGTNFRIQSKNCSSLLCMSGGLGRTVSGILTTQQKMYLCAVPHAQHQ